MHCSQFMAGDVTNLARGRPFTFVWPYKLAPILRSVVVHCERLVFISPTYDAWWCIASGHCSSSAPSPQCRPLGPSAFCCSRKTTGLRKIIESRQ